MGGFEEKKLISRSKRREHALYLYIYVRTQQRGFIKWANIDVRGNSVSKENVLLVVVFFFFPFEGMHPRFPRLFGKLNRRGIHK